jgi:hypothetical protein
MERKLNAQYNLAAPDSLAMRLAARARRGMFATFMHQFRPNSDDLVLDVGATSDRTYSSSNYFEEFYPYKNRLTASGMDDARFLEGLYPGVTFIFADALALPFQDRSFDYVHASAVLEHVGRFDNQARMISECARVARKGICLTTPNRWFPVEVHTQLPLLHWLPKPWFRSVLSGLGQAELAEERNLNLMSAGDLHRATAGIEGWSFTFDNSRLWGWTSNLVLFGRSRPE